MIDRRAFLAFHPRTMLRLAWQMTVAVALCSLLLDSTAVAQAPDTGSKGAVLGTGTFTAFVENMDRSLAFYHDAFGMEVPALPATGERPYNRANPQLFAMFDIPGARERHQPARVPAAKVNVELMEIQDVEHKTIPLRIQDPGNATLVLIVQDVGAALAQARKAGASVATPGGMPVATADGGRAVLVRDIDNRFVELRQPSLQIQIGPPAPNVTDMRLSIAVADLDRTTRVYRDVLEFKVEGQTPFAADAAAQALTGLTKAQMRRSRAQAPGSTLWIEFVEYKGVDRTPLKMRIQDRGAARLQIRAQNIDVLVSAMKQAGLTVVSQGAVAVPIPPDFKGALVADPDNFFLTPFAPCDGCTSRAAAPPGR